MGINQSKAHHAAKLTITIIKDIAPSASPNRIIPQPSQSIQTEPPLAAAHQGRYSFAYSEDEGPYIYQFFIAEK